MTDFNVKEKRFEQDIEEYLCSAGGYKKGNPAAFDRTLALDKATLLSFIQSTQPKSWEKFVRIYGQDSERQLIDRFCRVVQAESAFCNVLRNGFDRSGNQVSAWSTGGRKPPSTKRAARNTPQTSSTAHASCTTPSTTKTASTSCCYSTASPWSPWSSSASSPAKAAQTRLSNTGLTARATTRSSSSRTVSSRTLRSI